MAKYPDDLYYSKDHEWIRVEGDRGTVGITDHAQQQLGYKQGDTFGSVESVKAVSELYVPAGGEIVEVNAALADRPELVNTDPHGDGWMAVIRVDSADELGNLMKAADYEKYVQEEGGE
jgi:glycine cleavage system H protein